MEPIWGLIAAKIFHEANDRQLEELDAVLLLRPELKEVVTVLEIILFTSKKDDDVMPGKAFEKLQARTQIK